MKICCVMWKASARILASRFRRLEIESPNAIALELADQKHPLNASIGLPEEIVPPPTPITENIVDGWQFETSVDPWENAIPSTV